MIISHYIRVNNWWCTLVPNNAFHAFVSKLSCLLAITFARNQLSAFCFSCQLYMSTAVKLQICTTLIDIFVGLQRPLLQRQPTCWRSMSVENVTKWILSNMTQLITTVCTSSPSVTRTTAEQMNEKLDLKRFVIDEWAERSFRVIGNGAIRLSHLKQPRLCVASFPKY